MNKVIIERTYVGIRFTYHTEADYDEPDSLCMLVTCYLVTDDGTTEEYTDSLCGVDSDTDNEYFEQSLFPEMVSDIRRNWLIGKIGFTEEQIEMLQEQTFDGVL